MEKIYRVRKGFSHEEICDLQNEVNFDEDLLNTDHPDLLRVGDIPNLLTLAQTFAMALLEQISKGRKK